jgi:hypothetical protein
MLSAVASFALRRHEYGNVNTASLKADLLNSFNDQLRSGKLYDVDINNFHVEQTASR